MEVAKWVRPLYNSKAPLTSALYLLDPPPPAIFWPCKFFADEPSMSCHAAIAVPDWPITMD